MTQARRCIQSTSLKYFITEEYLIWQKYCKRIDLGSDYSLFKKINVERGMILTERSFLCK